MTKSWLLSLLLLLPAGLRAEPFPLEPVAFKDFSGGLNDSQDASNIDRKDAYDAGNVIIDDPAGSIIPRNGFIQCGTLPSGNTPKGLYTYTKSDGTSRLIVSDGSTYWQTNDCSNYTQIVTAQSTTSLPSFTTVRDKLWAVNGTTHPWTWNGVTYTLLDARSGTPSPAPPRGAYIEFWQERVWIARTNTNPSLLQFSALTMSDGGDVDPSTSSVGWPATNALYIDQGGGCPIYGLKAYRNNLYVHKGECGIWRVILNNDFDIALVKTLANVGTRFNDSIVERDGFQEFVGHDGIYAFDGDRTIRISDKIINKFSSLRQPLSNEAFKTWTVEGDFDDGTLNAISLVDTPGSITLTSSTFVERFEDANFTANPAWTAASSAGNFSVQSGALRLDTSDDLSTASTISTGAFQVSIRTLNAGSDTYWKFISEGNPGASLTANNGYGLQITRSGDNTSVKANLVVYPAGTVLATTPNITSNESTAITWKVIRTTAGVFSVYADGVFQSSATNTTFNTSAITIVSGNTTLSHFWDDFYYWSYNVTSGTWTSEDYNAGTAISSWTAFDATHSLGGGSVGYEIRVGTDSGALASVAYAAITPGDYINAVSSQVRVQVRATLTRNTGDFSTTPSLQDATVNWSEGEISDSSIYGYVWNNRYYVSAASGSSTSNNVVLARSKNPLNAWIPYDLQIGGMVTFNDRFYAFASTHSAIYRMDYGDNDNGAAIQWFWTSRAESWDDWTRKKRLLEIQVDYRGDNASNMEIAYSSNVGVGWGTRPIDMSAAGRGSTRQHVDGHGFEWMFRIANRTLGEKARILGITPWARKSVFRQ